MPPASGSGGPGGHADPQTLNEARPSAGRAPRASRGVSSRVKPCCFAHPHGAIIANHRRRKPRGSRQTYRMPPGSACRAIWGAAVLFSNLRNDVIASMLVGLAPAAVECCRWAFMAEPNWYPATIVGRRSLSSRTDRTLAALAPAYPYGDSIQGDDQRVGVGDLASRRISFAGGIDRAHHDAPTVAAAVVAFLFAGHEIRGRAIEMRAGAGNRLLIMRRRGRGLAASPSPRGTPRRAQGPR